MTKTNAAVDTDVTETFAGEAVLKAKDGHDIHVSTWMPETDTPRAVIQIVHGMGEYIDRYGRFAAVANERGLAVVGHNHRGHGPAAEQRGYFSPQNGWALLEADALTVREHVESRWPGVPVILLGHSMGSFVAQSFAMHYGGKLRGLILSGSTWPSRLAVVPGLLVAKILGLLSNPSQHSPFLDKVGFEAFNKRFEPARTELDWLSRDEAEVDKYVADPLCGGPYTIGLWQDLLGGMLRISSDDAVNRIPSDLPILITGGSADPVGGEKGLGKLMLHYAQTSHSRLKLKIYPDARHELLNETNRDEVTRDWLGWIEGLVGR